jgi:DNA-binding LacI/PurR family transcriptional regulator
LGKNDYSGYCIEAAKELATSPRKFTGATTFNDYTVIGLIHNLHRLGVRVPADISLVGYDNVETGALMQPTLTTVRPKLFDIGRLAGQMILKMMDGQQVEDVLLQPELVVRGSTAAPRNETTSEQ